MCIFLIPSGFHNFHSRIDAYAWEETVASSNVDEIASFWQNVTSQGRIMARITYVHRTKLKY